VTLRVSAMLCFVFVSARASEAQLPLVGGAHGQTLRVVMSSADRGATEEGCSARVQLSAAATGVAQKTFDLRPGQSNVLDVNLNRLTGGPGQRVELLPAVTPIAGACFMALEIYDNATGRTATHAPVLLLPASPGLLLPASGDPLTAVGVGVDQILRLGAARGFDPQPEPPACAGTLGFVDARGREVGPSMAIDLEPGGTAFLDLDPSLLLPAVPEKLRSRRFVRPRLLLPAAGGGDAGGCALSVQIFDKATGKTEAVYTQ
jgi:hypothetical protein